LGLNNVSNIACLTTYGLRLGAGLATWGVGSTGVLRGLPRLPLVVGAGFDSALDDLTALVWGAGEGLRVRDDLTGTWTFGEIRVDLARKGLALSNCCSTVNKE
jgi:hypothetical protein